MIKIVHWQTWRWSNRSFILDRRYIICINFVYIDVYCYHKTYNNVLIFFYFFYVYTLIFLKQIWLKVIWKLTFFNVGGSPHELWGSVDGDGKKYSLKRETRMKMVDNVVTKYHLFNSRYIDILSGNCSPP
jgi:hypothetical protein